MRLALISPLASILMERYKVELLAATATRVRVGIDLQSKQIQGRAPLSPQAPASMHGHGANGSKTVCCAATDSVRKVAR